MTENRQAYYDRIARQGLHPLWRSFKDLVPLEPRTPVKPCAWRYDEVRPALMEAGALITAQEAERRVLILENLGLPGSSSVTQTLYAGLQLILPGEAAPPHRHSQSALRLILEGDGAHTTVEGQKILMHPGDVVFTPSWTWHDHGNDTASPMVWLDGLDIPLVRTLDAGFAELRRNDGGPASSTTKLHFPYVETRRALDALAGQAADPALGIRLEVLDPVTHRSPMAIIGAAFQQLPAGFDGAPYRCTDGIVCAGAEGRGSTWIDGQRFDWGPSDVFVIPPWTEHRHESDEGAVLFTYSDRPVQKALGLWRERR